MPAPIAQNEKMSSVIAARETRTFIDALIASFASALRMSEGTARPAALLWTDTDSQWRELIPVLREHLAELYTLGQYNPSTKTGPAIWLKCIVDRTIAEEQLPADKTPVLYLPGVSRQKLRAGNDCPMALQPLIELQYRGAVWHQVNGRDWTVEAFMVSEEGLRLDVAKDLRTHEAMLRALPLIAETDVDDLRGRRLDADDFDRLAVADAVRDLLRWMNDQDTFRGSLDNARWEAFRNLCQTEFDLDPDEDSPTVAAAGLAVGGGKWDTVWERYCEAPRGYPGVRTLLREPLPGQGKFAFDGSRNPIVNEESEERLREDLEASLSLPHSDICDRVISLDREHGTRRAWVWAQLGESPLANVLEPLSRLASLAKFALGGESVAAMIRTYAKDGWRCDRAVLETLSLQNFSQGSLIPQLVRALYETWLDLSARHFQELCSNDLDQVRALVTGVTAEKDTCLLFVDGLRFDIAGWLVEELDTRGVQAKLTHRLSPIPTVTATAKPIAAPIHERLSGIDSPEDFTPINTANKLPVNTRRLRDAISSEEVEILDANEPRIPSGTEGGGWLELGQLDELGHKLGVSLTQHMRSDIQEIADATIRLLNSGWAKIRIVTDHGWLLLPGGMPKVNLPPHLVETKWARCAVVRPGAMPEIPTYPWYWNEHVRIASPPGIACFNTGVEYSHGGVSLQECVVPEITVVQAAPQISARIKNVLWHGMRCRVTVDTTTDIRVDMRLNWKQPNTSIVAALKDIGAPGEVSLVVDDEHEGSSAMIVAIDANGNILDRALTTVGETQ
jgi:hypothetical protein